MTTLRAFLSRPAADGFRTALVEPFKKILLEECDITPYESHQRSVGCQLSLSVIEAIRRCDLFIAIATSDDATDPTKTRPWLLAEIAIARAFAKEIVVFRDHRVENSNLVVASDLISIPFYLSDLSPVLQHLPEWLADLTRRVRSKVRIVRDATLDESVFRVTSPHRKEVIRVRELTTAGEKGRMDWITYLRGYEILYEQFDAAKAFPIDLVVGVNASGINVASYLDGRRDLDKLKRIPFGTVKSSPEDDSGDREYDLALPSKDVFDKISPPKRPSVLLVDSQLKTGASQVKIRVRISEYFGREISFVHAALIANWVQSPQSPSEDPLSMEELFTRPPHLQDTPFPKLVLPSFLAFISVSNIKPPEGLP